MNMTPKLKTSDFKILDDVFKMECGYVLDFTNATFSQFFLDELNINIDDPEYSIDGTSKAKRLRRFLRISNSNLVLTTLTELWKYKVSTEALTGESDTSSEAKTAFQKLLERFGGDLPDDNSDPEPESSSESISEEISKKLNNRLIEVSSMSPQRRGYAFEALLKGIFDVYSLSGKASFRLKGEQIDGSFQFAHEIYLLEAKWQSEPVRAEDLHTFHGKLGEKAAWSRGLFVSYSGFTEDGLHAFGRGKRIVCMSGLDFSDMLSRQISFSDVIDAKVRAAAETGDPYLSVRKLFP